MIIGEPGTGKDRVARSIHSNGPDALSPSFLIACNLMSSSLLERRLFGGLKGASVGDDTLGLLAALEGELFFSMRSEASLRICNDGWQWP